MQGVLTHKNAVSLLVHAESKFNNQASSCQLDCLTLQGSNLVCFGILEPILLKILSKSIHALVIVER